MKYAISLIIYVRNFADLSLWWKLVIEKIHIWAHRKVIFSNNNDNVSTCFSLSVCTQRIQKPHIQSKFWENIRCIPGKIFVNFHNPRVYYLGGQHAKNLIVDAFSHWRNKMLSWFLHNVIFTKGYKIWYLPYKPI